MHRLENGQKAFVLRTLYVDKEISMVRRTAQTKQQFFSDLWLLSARRGCREGQTCVVRVLVAASPLFIPALSPAHSTTTEDCAPAARHLRAAITGNGKGRISMPATEDHSSSSHTIPRRDLGTRLIVNSVSHPES